MPARLAPFKMACLTFAGVLLLAISIGQRATAGGPLIVGGPAFGTPGTPLIWDVSVPVSYRVDGGPLSMNLFGAVVIDNPSGLARVESMFQVWQDVPASKISYTNAGPLLNSGAFIDGDVNSIEELAAVFASCDANEQSPIVFDADGSMFAVLFGESGVIGFAGPCALDAATGTITAGLAVMNGRFQDGVTDFNISPANFELTAAEFDEVFTHEFGHFSGLDHSQINVNVLSGQPGSCSTESLAGLPLMFPFLFCQARSTAGLPVLAPDDVAWISKLYPNPSFSTTHGTISGFIFFSDGITAVQGVNVIARRVDSAATTENESLRIAFSVVSGFLFTGNPGQDVTADYLPCDPPSACPGGFAGNNSGGSAFGSRDPLLIGFYEIPVTPGSYTIEVESISEFFVGGSGVGPLSPPIPNPGPDEKWNFNESPSDVVTDSNAVSVTAGQVVSDVNIILNETGPRFDSFESSDIALLMFQSGLPYWLQHLILYEISR